MSGNKFCKLKIQHLQNVKPSVKTKRSCTIKYQHASYQVKKESSCSPQTRRKSMPSALSTAGNGFYFCHLRAILGLVSDLGKKLTYNYTPACEITMLLYNHHTTTDKTKTTEKKNN